MTQRHPKMKATKVRSWLSGYTVFLPLLGRSATVGLFKLWVIISPLCPMFFDCSIRTALLYSIIIRVCVILYLGLNVDEYTRIWRVLRQAKDPRLRS